MLSSQYLKCGYAGDHFPRAVVPCIVGRQRDGACGPQKEGKVICRTRLHNYVPSASLAEGLLQDLLVGHECAQRRHDLEVSYPVRNGIVRSWEDMHEVWASAFDALGAQASSSKILLTDPPLNPLENRMRLLETMFESFGFQVQ